MRAMSEQEEVFRAFTARADGHSRDAVVGAAANTMVNTLRQNHKTLGGALDELDDLVGRMKKILAERHYSEDGTRPVHNIIVPPLTRFD